MHVRVVVKVMLALVLGVATLLPATAAVAAISTPTGLSPSGTTESGTPVLSWGRVPDATSYDVEVSTDSFATTRWKVSTVNVRAVPTVALPGGPVQWRVRAKVGTTASEWQGATFTRGPHEVPRPIAPDNDAAFQQPAEYPVFRWSPVAGAQSYTVQVSPDEYFTDPAKIATFTSTSKSTSVAPGMLQGPNTYYWQVRAEIDKGVASSWSEPRRYTIRGLKLPDGWTPSSPTVFADDRFTSVDDAVLDWDPVPGAVTYELQVDTDSEFKSVDYEAKGIKSTRHARPHTLNNNQYYWRVRPYDAAGNRLEWAEVPVWKFRRHWPDQPTLVYPEDQSTVGDPFFYEWTGIPHASYYRLDLAKDPGMTEGLTSCYTRHTTWTPGNGESGWFKPSVKQCWPAAQGTFYWRVTGFDRFNDYLPSSLEEPQTVNLVGRTPVHRFTYDPQRVKLISPAAGSTVSLPRLTWEPVALAAKYRVTLRRADGSGSPSVTTTAATSLVPRTKLDVGATYLWDVQWISASGNRYGSSVINPPSFTVAEPSSATTASPEPDLLQPSSTGGEFTRFPTLKWSPVQGATGYTILIRPEGTISWDSITDLKYPAGEDLGTSRLAPVAPQTYEWQVKAHGTPVGDVLGEKTGRFTILPLHQVGGHRVSLSGSTANSDSCDASLPARCQKLRQTPVLSWDPVPEAGFYRLVLAEDESLTNVIESYAVENTRWAPDDLLPDGQAGSAFYWAVMPCIGSCSPDITAAHAFNKLSNPVVPTEPTASATVADDVTLSWRDYLESSRDAAPTGTALTSRPQTEARRYRVEVATDPAFANKIETAEVDQMSWTSATNTYPEGPVYWRVQAIDGSENGLAWSAPQVFFKQSPPPSLLTVADDAADDGPLRWSPLNFAASYEIEVYKNNDTVPNLANRVLNKITQQPSYSPTTSWQAAMAYTWRVRRVDASGRRGGWSAWGLFTGRSAQVALKSPAVAADVAPRESVFDWQAVTGAKAYRFETRVKGSATILETATTRAAAYAPAKVLPGGPMQWRVIALDGADQELGVAEWRDYSVRSGPVATTAVGISGNAAVGKELTALEPGWDMLDVTTTYAWLRDDRAITGATQASYTPLAADYGRKLTVRATGTRPGYDPGTATSPAVTVMAGDPLVPVVMPTVSGTARVGSTLTASTGGWIPAPSATPTYQWIADGVPIKYATRSTYVPTANVAGRAVGVRVTATASGYQPTTVESGKVRIARVASSTSVRLLPSKVKRTARAKVYGTIRVTGFSSPTGKVRIYRGARLLKTISLGSTSYGRISYRLPRQRVGRHKIKVAYSGNAQVLPSSRRVTLRVVR